MASKDLDNIKAPEGEAPSLGTPGGTGGAAPAPLPQEQVMDDPLSMMASAAPAPTPPARAEALGSEGTTPGASIAPSAAVALSRPGGVAGDVAAATATPPALPTRPRPAAAGSTQAGSTVTRAAVPVATRTPEPSSRPAAHVGQRLARDTPVSSSPAGMVATPALARVAGGDAVAPNSAPTRRTRSTGAGAPGAAPHSAGHGAPARSTPVRSLKTVSESADDFLREKASPPPLDTSSSDATQECLDKLAHANAWGAIVEATATAAQGPKGDVGEYCRVMIFRLPALVQCRKFAAAKEEGAILEGLKTGGKLHAALDKLPSGPSLRISLAVVPHWWGMSQSAADRGMELLREFEEEGKYDTPNGRSWCARTAVLVSQILLAMGSYVATGKICDDVLSKLKRDGAGDPTDTQAICGLLSQMGRVFLHVGALDAADSAFKRAAASAGESKQNGLQVTLNECAMHMARKDVREHAHAQAVWLHRSHRTMQYDSALSLAQEALPDALARADSGENETVVLPNVDASNVAAALATHLSLCALHTCQLDMAVSVLEDLIGKNPALMMTHDVCRNTCVLYELARTKSNAQLGKQMLQHIAQRYHLHHLSDATFRR